MSDLDTQLGTLKTRQKSPPFMPFFWLGISFFGGLLLANALPWHWGIWAGLLVPALAGLILSRVFVNRWRMPDWLATLNRWLVRMPPFLIPVAFFAGALIFSLNRINISPQQVGWYNERGTVVVEALVIKPPVMHNQTLNLVVQVQTLRWTGGKAADAVSGKILLQTTPDQPYAYGDVLHLTGELLTPPDAGSFSYQGWLLRQGVASMLQNARIVRQSVNQGNPFLALLFRLRANASQVLQRIFPAPESDLLAGILLGDDSGLSSTLDEAFRVTGTSHIIAISGFNIAILAGIFVNGFSRWFGRKWGAWIAIVVIVAYTILVGGSAAVVRAAIMGALGIWGGLSGRRQNGVNSLGLAALLMCLFDPHTPWDVGFQLSFMATLGLVLYAQPVEAAFTRWAAKKMGDSVAKMLASPVADYVLFTLIAQVITLPVMAYHFGSISALALLANPLILPPQPLVMILGGLALLGGLISLPLGKVMAAFALPLTRYTIRTVSWLGGLPLGTLTLKFDLWLVLLFYALLFGFTLLPDKKQWLRRLASPATALVAAALVLWVALGLALTAPDGKLHLTILPARGNAAILLQTPQGRAMLINGNAEASTLYEGLGQFISPFARQLDVLAVTSTHRDDISSLGGVLTRYDVASVLWLGNPEQNQTTRTLYQSLAVQRVDVVPLENGTWLDLGDGAQLQVLQMDAAGACFWLTWQQWQVLLPIGSLAALPVLPSAPDVVLLTGIGVDPAVLDAIKSWQPQALVWVLNPQEVPLAGDLPQAEALAGYPVLRTDLHGWVRFTSDGETIWVEVQK